MSIFNRRKVIPTEREFASAGKVSIWVGDLDSEDALLDYIEDERGFGADFGCVLLHSRELSVETQALPIRDLLEGFSWWKQFVDEAAAAAGDARARCAVVCHGADYRLLGFTPQQTAQLRLLCVASLGSQSDTA